VSLDEDSRPVERAPLPPALEALMAERKRALLIPLIAHNRLLGLVLLGGKRSQDLYSSAERRMVWAVATQAALAIENARLSRDVLRARERLLRSEKLALLGTLAAGIAHEVRNPLTSIKLNLQTMLLQPATPPEIRSKVERLLSDVERLEYLMYGMLRYAASEALQIEELDFPSLLDEALARATAEAGEGLRVVSITYEDVLRTIQGDRRRLVQAFSALLANAFRLLQDQGELEITVRLRPEADQEWIETTIEDRGPGIPEAELAEFFNPFFRRDAEGLSLGIASSLKFIEEHGGAVRAANRPGGGARITVRLPVVPDQDLPEMRDDEDPLPTSAARENEVGEA